MIGLMAHVCLFSPDFAKRLIWPGLLFASLTANLFFGCLYMYNNWR